MSTEPVDNILRVEQQIKDRFYRFEVDVQVCITCYWHYKVSSQALHPDMQICIECRVERHSVKYVRAGDELALLQSVFSTEPHLSMCIFPCFNRRETLQSSER